MKFRVRVVAFRVLLSHHWSFDLADRFLFCECDDLYEFNASDGDHAGVEEAAGARTNVCLRVVKSYYYSKPHEAGQRVNMTFNG